MKKENRYKTARTKLNKHGKQTVKQVAEATGVSKTTIDELESTVGKPRNPGIQNVAALAAYYGVTVGYLAGSEDSPTIEVNSRSAQQYTGLSESAVETLANLSYPRRTSAHFSEYTIPPIGIIDALITSKQFPALLESLAKYLIFSGAYPKEAYRDDVVNLSSEELKKFRAYLDSRHLVMQDYNDVADMHLQTACDRLKSIARSALKNAEVINLISWNQSKTEREQDMEVE